jgi:hypothetical protein
MEERNNREKDAFILKGGGDYPKMRLRYYKRDISVCKQFVKKL